MALAALIMKFFAASMERALHDNPLVDNPARDGADSRAVGILSADYRAQAGIAQKQSAVTEQFKKCRGTLKAAHISLYFPVR